MAIKDSFTAEEWARVVGAPMLAAIAVTAAEPGGLWGAVKESAASASGMLAGRKADNALIGEVVAAFETSEGRDMARGALKAQVTGKKAPEIVDAAVSELGAIATLVGRKAPAEAAGFSAWLKEIAAKVADAGSEGGFLGFGGEKVSAAEKATLDRLDTALA